VPLYEYQCQKCGHRFELIQKFSDPPAERCVSCGGPVERLISSSAFQFKGTGWYVTDYARKSAKGESPSGDGKSEKSTKSETAPGESRSTSSEDKPKTKTKAESKPQKN